MELHLFCTPGQNDIRHVVNACRPYLEDKDEPLVAFLPQAWLNVNHWLDYTVRAFDGLAQVQVIDTERMELPEMEAILRRAHVAYISGGNTFLLNHRLHVSRLMPYLKKKVQSGLPIVGFSAGAVLCGPNILTSNDLNTIATSFFDGLNLTPFNFFAHYGDESFTQAIQDDWLSDYHVFNDNPVVMMCDNAYVRVDGKKTSLVRGEAYILRRDQEKERLVEAKAIAL